MLKELDLSQAWLTPKPLALSTLHTTPAFVAWQAVNLSFESQHVHDPAPVRPTQPGPGEDGSSVGRCQRA